MKMNIHLQYALTLDDFAQFQRAYLRSRRPMERRIQYGFLSSRLFLRLLFVGFFIGMFLVLNWVGSSSAPAPAAPAAAGPPGPPPSIGAILAPLLPFVMVFVVVWGTVVLLRRSRVLYGRAFVEMFKLADPHTVDMNDRCITIRTPGSVIEMEWVYFFHFVETKSTFILFASVRTGYILPKRAFASEEEIAVFRNFALTHVGSKPIGFPVLPAAGRAESQFP